MALLFYKSSWLDKGGVGGLWGTVAGDEAGKVWCQIVTHVVCLIQ